MKRKKNINNRKKKKSKANSLDAELLQKEETDPGEFSQVDG